VFFIILYSLLLVLFLYLLNGFIQHGPAPLEELDVTPHASVPNTFREIFRHQPPRASGAGVVDSSPLDASEVAS
jgi:hypothetical protein